MAIDSTRNSITTAELKKQLLNDSQSPIKHLPSQRDAKTNSPVAIASQPSRLESQLPSTVPDSQFGANVDSQLDFTSPAHQQKSGNTQKMNTQDSSDRTQELSQTHYDDHIRSRSGGDLQAVQNGHAREEVQETESGLARDAAMHDEEEVSDEEDETKLYTQKPGDPGYIDLFGLGQPLDDGMAGDAEDDVQERASDDEGDDEQEQPLQDSAPVYVDFTPSQVRDKLSQYPESQRFATPFAATKVAGRKRTSEDAFIESPELPRTKPSFKTADRRSEPMGLSQAFGTTQANTSPAVGPVDLQLPSDRPSPSIEMQERPKTAGAVPSAGSSPMQMIDTVEKPRAKRAATEPASHYTPSKESQERREARKRARELEEYAEEEEDSDDDLALQPESWEYRERARWRREERAKKLLSSSPPRSSAREQQSKSSPVRPSSWAAHEEDRPANRTRITSPPKRSPTRPRFQLPELDSEAETEEEDDSNPPPKHSSQSTQPDEEDKENISAQALQVPETLHQPARLVNGIQHSVQDSPLLRQRQQPGTSAAPIIMDSSQAFDVADSQSERPSTRQQMKHIAGTPIATDGLDYVPQSPEGATEISEMPRNFLPAHVDDVLPVINSNMEDGTNNEISNEAETIVPASTSQSRQVPGSTIPETSSNDVPAQSSSDAQSKVQTNQSEDRGEFETAQTHPQSPGDAAQQLPTGTMSSQPIAATPPGKRRRRVTGRLAELEADPSPLRSQVSFIPSQSFRDDALLKTPSRSRLGAIKKAYSSLPAEMNEGENGPVSPSQVALVSGATHDLIMADAHPAKETAGEENADDHIPPSPTGSEAPVRSLRGRKPAAKAKNGLKPRPRQTLPKTRVSQWDLEETSPQKVVPTATPLTKKRKAPIASAKAGPDFAGPTKRLMSSRKTSLTTKLRDEDDVPEDESPDPIAFKENLPSTDPATAEPQAAVPDPEDQAEDQAFTAPNMVFACFNGNSRTYHPALCRGRSPNESNRFVVQWEGYAPDEVDEHGIRRLELRVGDQVKIELDGFPKVAHIVRGFKDQIDPTTLPPSSQPTITDMRGYRSVLVAPKQRKNLPADVSTDAVKKVPVSSIYLDSNMWTQIKDRVYEHNSVVSPTAPPAISGTSTPAIVASTPSTPTSRHRRGRAGSLPPSSSSVDLTRGLFAQMAFVVSYSDDNRKRQLLKLIRDNGGTVLKEDFLNMFEKDTATLKPKYSDFTFAALLIHGHSRKAKYLQALALGLPCLSGRWVDASVQADKLAIWTTYLLPAGESAELEGAAKSRVLSVPEDMSRTNLQAVMDQRPITLKGSRALFIAPKLRAGKAKDTQDGRMSLVHLLDPTQVDIEQSMADAKALIESAATTDDPVNFVFVGEQDVETAMNTLLASFTTKRGTLSKKAGKRGKAAETTDENTKQSILAASQSMPKILSNEDISQSLILGRWWSASS